MWPTLGSRTTKEQNSKRLRLERSPQVWCHYGRASQTLWLYPHLRNQGITDGDVTNLPTFPYRWCTVWVCGSTISTTRPVPDDATRTRTDPRRKFLPIADPTSGYLRVPVPVAFLYDYRTISVKPMARGGTARESPILM